MRSPSLRLRLAYRLLGWRLGPEHRDWVAADVRSPGWPLRAGLAVAVAVGVPAVLLAVLAGADLRRLVLPAVAVLVLSAVRVRALRERALRLQGLTPEGEVDPAAPWYGDADATRSRNQASAAFTVVLVGGALAVLAWTAR